MKMRMVLLSAMLLMLAVPVFAGSGEKCSQSTQVCLNHWAEKKDAGWAGLEYDKSQEGVVKIKAITVGSPAEAAGFQIGDVIMAINGASMTDKAALKKAKGDWKTGQAVSYTVQRAGAEQQLSLTLAKTPEHVYSAMVGMHMLESHAAVATAAMGDVKAKPASTGKK